MPEYLTPGVYIKELNNQLHSIQGVPTGIPVFIGYTEKALRETTSLTNTLVAVNSLLEFQQYFGGAENTGHFLLYNSLKLFYANGGKTCYIISVGDHKRKIQLADLENGLAVLARTTIPTLLLIPEAIHLYATDCYYLQNKMIEHCGRRKYRMTILDIYEGFKKRTSTFDPIEQFRNAITCARSYRSFGAAYYPWVKTRDGFLPPSAAIAGIYVATDEARGVWKAPANVALQGITSLTVKIDNAEQEGMNVDAVNGLSINALRYFTGKGNLVWGARTLAGNDNEWRYVPVRRLAMYLEQSIKAGIKPYQFSPNNISTWTSIKAAINNFLTTSWRAGALQGAKTSKAFFVKCGLGETMTEIDIDNNRLIVEIGFAPVRPAEFVILKISQKQRG